MGAPLPLSGVFLCFLPPNAMKWWCWHACSLIKDERPDVCRSVWWRRSQKCTSSDRYCLVNPRDKCVKWENPSGWEIVFQLNGEFSLWFNAFPFKTISVFTRCVYGICFRKRVADGYQRPALAQMLFSTPKDIHFAFYQHLFQRLRFELMAFWVYVRWAPPVRSERYRVQMLRWGWAKSDFAVEFGWELGFGFSLVHTVLNLLW